MTRHFAKTENSVEPICYGRSEPTSCRRRKCAVALASECDPNRYVASNFAGIMGTFTDSIRIVIQLDP